jgi:hypothetical protein
MDLPASAKNCKMKESVDETYWGGRKRTEYKRAPKQGLFEQNFIYLSSPYEICQQLQRGLAERNGGGGGFGKI